MKTGPKPRKITTQLLEQIEIQAFRGLSQQRLFKNPYLTEFSMKISVLDK